MLAAFPTAFPAALVILATLCAAPAWTQTVPPSRDSAAAVPAVPPADRSGPFGRTLEWLGLRDRPTAAAVTPPSPSCPFGRALEWLGLRDRPTAAPDAANASPGPSGPLRGILEWLGLRDRRAASDAPRDIDPDSLAYTVTISPTGDDTLDAALAAVSQLVALQTSAPTSAGGVLGRAEAEPARLQLALQSEGYWAGTSRVELAGLDARDPALPARLDRIGRGPLPITITATPGPQYRISRIAVRATTRAEQPAVDAAMATPFGLAVGDPARAGPVLAAEGSLLDRLLASGHPLASMVARDVVVDHDRRTMEVAWSFAPGPLARFAAPEVVGATRVDPAFLARRASRIAGEVYSPERLEQQRRDLASLGPFGSVRATTGTALDAAGRLPTTFTVSERLRHALGASVAYETNYGPSIRLYWEHRNLFGAAERLRLEADIARLGANGGVDRSTFRIGATYRDPNVLDGRLGPEWSFVGSVFGLRERLDPYDRDALTLTALLERRFSERLTAALGPVLDFGAIGPPDTTLSPYQVIGFQFSGRYDGADSLLDPSRGYRVTGSLTPSYAIRESAPFAPLKVTASTYWDVLGDRRGILALRGTVGSLLGAELTDVPRHLRFYAGGGGSVRGYDYQSIGPRDARGFASGGASLLEASVEWRQRIWGDIGGVAFVDAGSVGIGTTPQTRDLRVGAGIGLRYYTPIGPIRADIAVPLVNQQSSSGYGVYIGIGQAF